MLLAFTANANPIRVVGTGIDIESAKHNGFSNAIDVYVGTVVLSERELHNYKLTKNQILVYSSGYVDDFKIISQINVGNQLQVVMDVSVNTNKISDRILGKFSSNEIIDNDRIKAQIDSYQRERQNADQLLNTVLKDYPYRAYNVEPLPYYISTTQRKMQLVMPYRLTWNYNYIVALNSVLSKTQDAKPKFLGRNLGHITVSAKDPNDLVFGKTTKFYFNDLTQPQEIVNTFYNEELRVMARINDKNNQTVWYICHHPSFLSGKSQGFYSIGDTSNVVLFGNSVEQGEVKLDISPELYRILQNSYKIELQIVKKKDC